ncbi:MAG: hypothetical protein P4M15_05070 [Alphaproteobacteria bacterium]|nr:hypothetical protein [Alphaproteobacteria bacterium]
MKKICAALVLTLTLAACASDLPPPAPAPAAHALPPKINLDVQAINLADRSGLQPLSSPYNDNHFSPTIADAIKQWASDRLQAAGQSGQAIIVVKDASLISQALPMQQGMDGWFTRQQGSKYIGRAEVSVEANGHQGFATADAVATRSVTLPENPTAVEKQNAYYSLLNGLMKDLGENLESAIQAHMNSFVITAPIYSGSMAPLPPMGAGEIISPTVIQEPTPSPPVPIASAVLQSGILEAPVTATQVSPPVVTISQAQPAGPAQDAPLPLSQTMPALATAPVVQPQAPVFGTTAVPTIPNTASMPSSFTVINDTQRQMPAPGPTQVAMPPLAPLPGNSQTMAPVMAPVAMQAIAPMPPMDPIPAPSPNAIADAPLNAGQQSSSQAVTIPLSRGPYAQ